MDKNPAYIYHFRLSVDNEGLYMGFTPLFAVAKCFHKEKTPSTGVNGVKVQFRSGCAAVYVKRRIISWAVSTRRNMVRG